MQRLATVALCLSGLAACSAEPPPPPIKVTEVVEEPRWHEPLGDLVTVDPAERRFYANDDFFAPIPEPQPGDWLSEHHEPGQIYADFLSSRPNIPTPERDTIYIQPLDPFPEDLPIGIADLEAFITRYFAGIAVKVLPAVALAETKATTRGDKPQIQALTSDLLAWLQQRLPPDGYAIVGLTMVDLYPKPSWNFVFGQALRKGRAGIYSFARFDPAFDGGAREPGWQVQFVQRAFGIVAHEIGHLFGMAHCTFHHCLMNGTNSLDESDRAPLVECPVCLRKLHNSLGFDVLARYRDLADLYQGHGLNEPADWLRRRLAHLTR